MYVCVTCFRCCCSPSPFLVSSNLPLSPFSLFPLFPYCSSEKKEQKTGKQPSRTERRNGGEKRRGDILLLEVSPCVRVNVCNFCLLMSVSAEKEKRRR